MTTSPPDVVLSRTPDRISEGQDERYDIDAENFSLEIDLNDKKH